MNDPIASTYTEVSADDRDVALFITQHLDSVNLYKLPVKMWAAREGDTIIAVMMLKTDPYPSLDLIVANPKSRPFMRIFKLLRVAEAWLRAQHVPMIALSIKTTRVHFQSLVRRLGYKEIGTELDEHGTVVETIFGRALEPSV